MSSEEKISPEEFDKELDSLLAGTTEKKPKNPKRKKIIIAAAIAILGITGIKLLSGGKDMVPVVDTVTPTRKTIQNRLTVTGPISGTDSVDVVSNLHAEILEIPVKEGDKVTKGQPLAVLDDSDVKKEADIAKNDYDLAVANTAAAVRAGFHGVHVTVNGLGERAGNAPLSSAVAVLHDRLGRTTGIDETKINHVSRMVETYTGIRIPGNRPIVGESVFTQCAGIHADGDNKNNLYFNELLPERFGRVREYALGKTSGKANVLKNLEALGIDLDEAAMRKVTERVVELSDKKEQVTAEDLPYIIADVLRYDPVDTPVRILNYSLSLAQGMHPVATLRIEIHGCAYERTSAGDGQYDAFMRALRQIYREQLGREFPMLRDYTVSIPPGGRTDAFVQTIITWEMDGREFKTRGLDADQTEAAIKATVKMLNIIEINYNDNGC